MEHRRSVRLLKLGVWLAALIPAGRFMQRWFFGDRFGVNPIEELLLWSGLSALVLLFASLAVTPIRRLTGWNDLQKVRRLVGLWAFAYAVIHVGIYLWLDQFFAWSFIWEDVTERPFIIAGTVAFLMLLPLALTSTRGWIRRLGRRWVRLHWLVYPAAGSALLHYVWKQKADFQGPIVAGAVLALLLGLRVWWRGRDKAAQAPRGGGRGADVAPQGQPG